MIHNLLILSYLHLKKSIVHHTV